MTAADALAAAVAAQQRGEPALALTHFATALALAPALLPVRLAAAYARAASGDPDGARALLAAHPGRDRLAPTDARTLAEAALALRADQVADEALALARASAPDDVRLLAAQAGVADRLGDAPRARALVAQALAHDPRCRPALLTHARLCAAEHEWDQATAALDAAIAIDPAHPLPRYQRALLRLTLGETAQGFADVEARTALDWFRSAAPTHCPPWTGAPMPGRTLVAWGEQGLGDQLQFMRFVPQLAAVSGAQLLLRVAPPLVSLATQLPGVAAVVPSDAPWPAADAHVPLMSLPLRLGLLAESTWGRDPYLTAPPAMPPHTPMSPLRVALVWAGNPGHAHDHERSLPLDALRALPLDAPIRWQSLQLGGAEAARAAHPVLGRAIAPPPPLPDFAATARALAACDLLLTADTAVAHLAGALGRPTWLLVPPLPDWRWQRDRLDSPWYGSLTLWRRAPGEGWPAVLARVGAALVRRARSPQAA